MVGEMTLHTPRDFAKRLIEAHGGHDRFFALMDQRLDEFNAVWEQDAGRIGRVLRAHLAVEHFLTEYLQFANPNLGVLDNARLSFSQKVELISDNDRSMESLKVGLRRLNTIRNRIAHKLQVDIRSEDREALLGISMFKAMRAESMKRHGPKPEDALSVIEQFATFAAGLLQSGSKPEDRLWREALEAENGTAKSGDRSQGDGYISDL